MISLDELPSAVKCLTLSFELNPANSLTHRVIVSDLAIPLHQLMHKHYYKEDIKRKANSASQNNDVEIKEIETDKKDNTIPDSTNKDEDKKEEEEEDRSINKYGLNLMQLKALEDTVIALRAKVGVQQKINEINYRGLTLIDRLVQTEYWRRETRLKLLLMRSARYVLDMCILDVYL